MILVKEKGLRESGSLCFKILGDLRQIPGSLCFKILGDLRQIPGSMLESAPPTTVKGCCSHKIHHGTKNIKRKFPWQGVHHEIS